MSILMIFRRFLAVLVLAPIAFSKIFSILAQDRPSDLTVVIRSQTVARKTHGIDFGPYLPGQSPPSTQLTSAQILARLQIIAPYTTWVRSYSMTGGNEYTPGAARQLGLKMAATAWISTNMAQNNLEIANLITAANARTIDVAIVGSETILRGDVSTTQLINYMNQVRAAIPSGIPVVTSDSWGTFIAHPELISASDQVWANFYPYWDSTSITYAICSLEAEYQQVVNSANGKTVVVAETGWPTGGDAHGAAVPSLANAVVFADQFLTWADSNGILSFYFEGLNEDFKTADEGPQGAYWGLFDESGELKSGMDAWFNGQNANATCTGTPVISFTYVPPYGSPSAGVSELLQVEASGVLFQNYVVATYIDVGGGWWTKPYFASPTVALTASGAAAIPIVTGGNDQLASAIEAYLIPSTCAPPQAGGGGLPALPCAVASLQVSRTQSSISGTILDLQNNPIVGATVSDPVLGSQTTDSSGSYSFFNVTKSGTATLSVSYPSFAFSNSPAVVAITSGNVNVNFTGTQVSAPTAPVPLSPSNGTTVSSVTPQLNWSASATATSYDVYFSTSASPQFAANTTGLGFNPGALSSNTLAPGTTYYWFVVAKNSAGSTNSPTWSFTTPQTAPSAPVLNSPGNGTTGVGLTPSLSWNAASNATSYDVYFGAGGSPQFVINTASTSYSPAALSAGTTYSWMVVAKNAAGTASSATWSFTTFIASPSVPALLSPGNGAGGVSTAPILSWSGASNATSYDVYFGTTPSPQLVTNTTATSYSPGVLAPGTTFSWYVVAKNAGGSATSATWIFTTQPAANGLVFVPVAPCRLVDTRVPVMQSGFGPPAMGAGEVRTFAIPSNTSCGIPANAAAYSVNITVVTKGYLGILTIWPAGQTMPNVSTLNSYLTTSTAVANAAIVPAGSGGRISVYVTDATDLVIDINGYFMLAASGLEFHPVTPCRLVDTRVPSMQSGFGPPSMAAGMTRSFAIPSNSACGIPLTAAAYSLNVTAVPQKTLGFLSIWPTGQPLPNVSTLNVYTAGTVVANAAIVPAGANGAVSAYVTDGTDLVIDIDGYFSSANGLKFYPITPCRAADTRVPSMPVNLGPPTMAAGMTRSFPVAQSACGIPLGTGPTH